MATLVLTAVGTALGGPLGGALGAFAGRSVDTQIFGSGAREGARLEELAVSTSSYGTPLPHYFGSMRCAGSIIWATELSESSETSGGKGKPKTTHYSYSASFAVALASRPIRDIGRIWANGNLLREADGKLKTGGILRIHHGYADQPADPLIRAAEGAGTPAFRGTAYVVFEDLQLADFGNRIPALTFEIIANDHELKLSDIVADALPSADTSVSFPQLKGFSYKGGALGRTLDLLGRIFPLIADSSEQALKIVAPPDYHEPALKLPGALANSDDTEFGALTGLNFTRQQQASAASQSLRYYDLERDYLPNVQRSGGRAVSSGTELIEFPGTFTPDGAKQLIEALAQRTKGAQNSIRWRMAEIDPDLRPGQTVFVPGQSGKWRIQSWEWRDTGVELELMRLFPDVPTAVSGDSGNIVRPPNLALSPTYLRAFELPWTGTGPLTEPRLFAATSGTGGSWGGAALFTESTGHLISLGASGKAQATGGKLAAELGPSPAMVFEKDADIEIDVNAPQMAFVSATREAIAEGQNQLLVGSEIIQFASAEQIRSNRWKLQGLLRGRGGTEAEAANPHPVGTLVTLLDETIIPIDLANVSASGASRLAAIGKGDENPVSATFENIGVSTRPLSPVHGRIVWQSDGSLAAHWIRRARGAWQWLDSVEPPLNEEKELYCVGVGSFTRPSRLWTVTEPTITLSAETLAPYSRMALWVQQIGTHAKSQPLLLTEIP